jgi:hypothetical protein
MMTKWIYENEQNNNIRYVLGIEGNKPLVCFGINPSTASPQNLDNTLKSVQRLAFYNGFDSWIMFNIYPQRATNPKNIHQIFDKKIHKKNLYFIEKYLSTTKHLWAAWGTIIEKRSFLINCLSDIYNISKKYNSQWLSIGKISKNGHPHHPLYLRKDEKTKKFDMDSYMKKLLNY